MTVSSRRRELADRLLHRLGEPLPPPVDRRVRPAVRWAARRTQWLAGRLEGIAYQLEGRRPAPDVDDARLVQRVRSVLGPVEKQLDLPRVHVASADRVVVLHGVVDTDDQARRLVQAAERVAGVRAVRPRLHVGMGPGDTRPSEGRALVQPSAAWRELVGAARGVGLSDDGAERAAQAVLATLLHCLPDGERRHVLAHLPEDVRMRTHAPLEVGRLVRPRSVGGFDRAVANGAQLVIGDASLATRAVLDALRGLVPEEVEDVEAVLPAGLKPLWAAPATVDAGA